MDASVGIALTQVKASGRLSIHRDIVGNSVCEKLSPGMSSFFARSLSADRQRSGERPSWDRAQFRR